MGRRPNRVEIACAHCSATALRQRSWVTRHALHFCNHACHVAYDRIQAGWEQREDGSWLKLCKFGQHLLPADTEHFFKRPVGLSPDCRKCQYKRQRERRQYNG